MKNNIIHILIAAFSFLTVASCNEVILMESVEGEGYLSVSLDRDDEVFSKALVAPEGDMAFRIMVYRDQELVADVADHRTLTQSTPLTLRVGKYRVVASYGDNTAGFDKPYYVGETEVTVKTDIVTEAQIVCKLANVMVTVEFEQSIIDNFPTYSVFVEDGSMTGAGLGYSSDLRNISRIGYIPATGTLKWNLRLVNRDGTSFVSSSSYTNVKAQQHYNLKFALGGEIGENGYAAIKLIVDDTLVEQEFNLELDFSESELPTFAANDGFALSNEVSVIVGDNSKKELTFSSPEGIRSLILALDENVVTRAAAPLAWYELVEASQETIALLTSKGIKVSSIAYGATTAVIDMTDYIASLPTGDYNIDVTLYDTKGHVADCPMDISVISEVDADMVSVIPWAKFAIVKGKYFSTTPPEGMTFMYKKALESSWTSVPSSALDIDTASKTFEAEIGGLAPGSNYVIKAVSAADTDTREVEFSTESAETLYNMNFDEWYQDGKVWYPYAQGANPTIWDSANKGAATFIGSSTSPVEGGDAVKGKAARMESKYAVIAFAAGNLYAGKFGKIDGVGAQLEWGVPFESRPLALRGYYKYTSAKINRGESAYQGQPDKAQIQVAITDWSAPFQINTKNGEFVDFSADYIIAHGKLESSQSHSDYVEFTIPLEYRTTSKRPTYIIVSAAASYLGDYFTGGEGSTLYLDELSFEYDATRLTDEQKQRVNYR